MAENRVSLDDEHIIAGPRGELVRTHDGDLVFLLRPSFGDSKQSQHGADGDSQ